MIPLCIWGIVASLMIHLIAVRSIFVQGGEGRLRLAVLAFAAGVILLQRLIRTQGATHANAYAWGIGAAMGLFALHNAFAYRLPVHPMIVFVFNVMLFGTLWWVVHRITAACSADSPEAIAAATESGSLRGLRLRLPRGRKVTELQTVSDLSLTEEAERRWEKKLPAAHPGRMLLYFSLFAVPAFGLGVYLFGEGDAHRSRLGILLFLYVWCILALLFLSSLSQLSNYFETRGVTLPESVGVTWLAIGFATVTLMLAAAFFLPQPHSPTSAYVRERMVSAYAGWEARRGFTEVPPDEGAPAAGRNEGGGGAADASATSQSRGSGGGEQGGGGADRRGDGEKERFETKREGDATTDADAVSRAPERRSESRRARGEVSGLDRFFERAFAVTIWIGAGAAAIVLLAVLLALLRGAAGGLAELRFRKRKAREKAKPERAKGERAPAEAALRRFADPFAGPSRLEDGDELIRYLWRATLAWCAAFGTPCGPGQTPSEFLASEPGALKGFEEPARFLAGLVNFSEFSGERVPDATRPKLQEYWMALQRHARTAR